MLPRLNENGYLPEGVWDCSLEELRAAFGVFRRSDQRSKLFSKLEEFIKEIGKTRWVKEIIVDGSFVTGKSEPNDIDVIIGLDSGFEDAEISFWESRLLNKKFLSKKYGFDVFIEIVASKDFEEKLDFFQQIKQSETRKGVARLIL